MTTGSQTDLKRVVGDNATLPCHHQFWVGDDPTLDIEWLLLKPTNRQRVVCVSLYKRLNENSANIYINVCTQLSSVNKH